MNKNIFIACDTTNLDQIRKIIKETKTKKLKIGYKFGLEFFYSKSGRSFLSKINKNKIISEAEWGGKNFGISTALGSWALHYKSWEQIKFAPILIIKYEDLIKDKKVSICWFLDFYCLKQPLKL